MKSKIINQYPDVVKKIIQMREENEPYIDIWRKIFLTEQLITIHRCSQIVRHIFSITEEESNYIEQQAMDLIQSKYQNMKHDGVSKEDIFRAALIDTRRRSFSRGLLENLFDTSWLDALHIQHLVFIQEPELKTLSQWQGADRLPGIPVELTQTIDNHFYLPENDIAERWRIFGFFISPDQNSLTLRFCTFSDDLPDYSWMTKDYNALEDNLIQYVKLDHDLLPGLVKVIKVNAERLKPTISSLENTFVELREDETQQERLRNFSLSAKVKIFLQAQSAAEDTNSNILRLSDDGNNLHISVIHRVHRVTLGTYEDKPLNILHLSRSGAFEFCNLLEKFVGLKI